jgi:4,5-DOPA dioxygenase extradiol
VPVFQVSLPTSLDADRAWGLGKALAPLAEEGVLIVGSGSLTHNLHEFFNGIGQDQAYVAKFATWVRDALESGDHTRLRRTLLDAPFSQRAHPTPEHFLPLLVAAGAANLAAPVNVIEGGIDHGILAMDSYVFWEKLPPP